MKKLSKDMFIELVQSIHDPLVNEIASFYIYSENLNQSKTLELNEEQKKELDHFVHDHLLAMVSVYKANDIED